MRGNGTMCWRRGMGPSCRRGRPRVNGRRRDRGSHSPTLCGTNYGSNPQGKQPKTPYLAHGALPGSSEQASQYHRCPTIRGGFTEGGCTANCPPTIGGRKAFFFRLESILPRHVGSRWSGGGHVAGNLRHDALVEGTRAFEVRHVASTHVAVGLSRAVFKVGDAVRVSG